MTVVIVYPRKAAPWLIAGRILKRIGLRKLGGMCIAKANSMAKMSIDDKKDVVP